MAYRTILVEVADDGALEARLQAARALAGRFDAVLIGMHVMPSPFVPVALGDGSAYLAPDLIEAQRAGSRLIKEKVQAVFRSICGAGPDAIWQEVEGDPGDVLAGAARTTDLLLARQAKAGRADLPDVLDQLVTAAGVPVLVLPSGVDGHFGHTVMIAWNGSCEATRAAHDALPFLHAADRVVLCAVGGEAFASLAAATAMLKRHGVAAEPRELDEPDGAAGAVLLAEAAAQGVDLLVMGAYGHSRLRELVFGGATRHVLRAGPLPVLFGS
jgi:nucleotide-binding universal stress UspA family protein